MTGLPMVENRLPRLAAEGQNRHVAAKGERPGLDPQRLARLDRRDLIPGEVQRRVKHAEEYGRAKVDSALVDPDIDRIPVADPARKTADHHRRQGKAARIGGERARSEERSVGKEGVSRSRSRWAQDYEKKK